ncbi:hypothetical protein KYB31_10275 [Clostridium felsineum]|uniref:SAF domain-containing protein n=1 Tax=Clostridium felsineum TaxID=36839 RepID=UPI00214D5531|nr:SAF domain-containing protein [Clostridium felsineum]MCR3759372.1 hypothetical protein [Clostridium felsineum]
MHFRAKTVIGTTLIAAALFGTLIFIEDKAINRIPKTAVLVAVKNIDQGTVIKKNDFKEVEYSCNDVNSYDVKKFNDIKNSYATENIYKGEILNKNRVDNKNDNSKIFLEKNQKEISVPLAKCNNDTFVGTLRKGDIIDITHTDNTQGSEIKTEIEGKSIKVIGAVDSEGKILTKDDKSLASSIMVEGSEENFLKISKDLASGYFSLAKSSLK